MIAAILAHAAREYPREACGLVVRVAGVDEYRPCRNIALGAAQFALCPEDYAAAEDAGEVRAVVHSHPDGTAAASPADRAGCARSGLPWLIVSWPAQEVTRIEPEDYDCPLEGRPYLYGVWDCWTLVQDYYRQRLGIRLDGQVYEPRWAECRKDYIRARYAAAGFVAVPPAQLAAHDVLALQGEGLGPATHLAVYLGDSRLLHQPANQLSRQGIYGGHWQRCTTLVLRHRSRV